MNLFSKFVLLFLLFLSMPCFGQGETWNWCFGDSAGIKFVNGKNPIPVNSFKGWSYEGTSILNDSLGRIVLYSYSKYLYDSSHKRLNINFILKGGNSSCQPIQLIKHRKSKDLHIFTTSPEYGVSTDGFNYIIYNNGFKTPYKKIFRDIGEKQTNIFSKNNSDIWITTHSARNDTFYSFLVKKDGQIDCPVINKIGPKYKDRYPGQGILKYSPSGKLCANANWDLSNFNIFSFDNESGKFTSIITISQFYPYSIEFSPDEKYIYIGDRGENIFQFSLKDLRADSILKSRKTIYSISEELFSQMQLGPDKKIYIAVYGKNFLSCINRPNEGGDSCKFVYNAVNLGNRRNEGGLPNFNAGYFYTPSIDYAYEQDCRTNTITFEGKDTIKATSYKWVFSKGSKTEVKATKDASYTFADTGKWQVKYIASNGNRSDTVSKTITIRPKLEQGFLGEDIKLCKALPLKLNAPTNLHCIHWYNDTMAEIGKTDSINITKPGTYYAKATNQSFCVEWDTILIDTGIINPRANFTLTDVCVGDSAVFKNNSKDGISYSWKFGDGLIATNYSPKHYYPNSITTTYNVTLTTQFRGGCADSLSKQITINAKPKSGFTYFTSGQIVSFTANEKNANIYKWSLGDGGNDTITNNPKTTHDYAKFPSGKYKVCLRVTNLAECFSDTCIEINSTGSASSVTLQNQIVIYPNPSKGKLIIEISKTGNYNLKVFNETGQMVIQRGIQGNQANTVLLNQAKGSYMIEIVDEEGGKMRKKVIIE